MVAKWACLWGLAGVFLIILVNGVFTLLAKLLLRTTNGWLLEIYGARLL
jgi:hypothetical protein